MPQLQLLLTPNRAKLKGQDTI
jgi:hypothetical protein